MIISNSHRFIFIHLHKTGGTSLEVALEKYLGWNDILLGSTNFGEMINDYYRKRFGLHKHSSVMDIEGICGEEILRSYYVFSLVRNPVSRIVSLYNFVGSIVLGWADSFNLNILEIREDPEKLESFTSKRPELGWASSRAFIMANSFSEFIRSEMLRYETAFRTQASQLRSRNGTLIGEPYKIEMAEDWQASLSRKLGLEIQMHRENESPRKLIAASDLSSEDTAFLKEKFREDFVIFGYE